MSDTAAALVQSLSVTRSIPSVADSSDSIGTTVNAETRPSLYGIDAAYAPHGFLSSTIRSADGGHTIAGGTWSVTVGIENLFDRRYRDFMSGFNRVADSAIPVGSRLAGTGRNAYATLDMRF